MLENTEVLYGLIPRRTRETAQRKTTNPRTLGQERTLPLYSPNSGFDEARPLVDDWSRLTHASHSMTISSGHTEERPLVDHWSRLTHASHSMTISRPAAATQRRDVERKNDTNWIKRCTMMEVDGTKPEGCSNMTQ